MEGEDGKGGKEAFDICCQEHPGKLFLLVKSACLKCNKLMLIKNANSGLRV